MTNDNNGAATVAIFFKIQHCDEPAYRKCDMRDKIRERGSAGTDGDGDSDRVL